MSNAYINQILFGNSKEEVTAEYIEGLLPLMLTTDFATPNQPSNPIEDLVHIQEPIVTTTPDDKIRSGSNPRRQLNTNSLFWSIYEVENPEEAFLGTKANAEIAHRIKVIDELKKTPKILKETNSKLTIDQTQALFGKMLTAKEDNLDFCIAYAAYYKKPIIVVYKTTYRVFSPTVEVNISEEEDPIVLYATKQDSSKNVTYDSEKNLTQDILQNIINSRAMGPLRSMSSYKNPELDELAAFFKIPITQDSQSTRSKEKRRSKEDIYNDIKVAIHNDMNFIQ
jgi:NADH dehydrogenase/NADH:ubiquinone oxidoreductase subunit G